MAKKRFRDKNFAAAEGKSRQITREVAGAGSFAEGAGHEEAELGDEQVGGRARLRRVAAPAENKALETAGEIEEGRVASSLVGGLQGAPGR